MHIYNSDIFVFSETKLKDSEKIICDGYSFYFNNRSPLTNRINKASGGVGILVKNSILSHCKVVSIADKFEGIVAILLEHKLTEFHFTKWYLSSSCKFPLWEGPWQMF